MVVMTSMTMLMVMNDRHHGSDDNQWGVGDCFDKFHHDNDKMSFGNEKKICDDGVGDVVIKNLH